MASVNGGSRTYPALRSVPVSGPPFAQPTIRPAPASRRATHRDGGRLLLPHQHQQPLVPRDSGIERVPLQHGVVVCMVSKGRDLLEEVAAELHEPAKCSVHGFSSIAC